MSKNKKSSSSPSTVPSVQNVIGDTGGPSDSLRALTLIITQLRYESEARISMERMLIDLANVALADVANNSLKCDHPEVMKKPVGKDLQEELARLERVAIKKHGKGFG